MHALGAWRSLTEVALRLAKALILRSSAVLSLRSFGTGAENIPEALRKPRFAKTFISNSNHNSITDIRICSYYTTNPNKSTQGF